MAPCLLSRLRRGWAIAGTTVLIVFPLYMAWSFSASAAARQALESGTRATVEARDDSWLFEPAGEAAGTGLIILPGSLVDPVAYAPLARFVAESGFPVVLQSLPWRMFGPLGNPEEVFARILRVVEGDPQRRWILGGHSKGGALAADFAARFSSRIDGLLLIGTSHPRERDLSRLDLPVTKVYGTHDGLASVEEVERFARNLPAQTRWAEIPGGNHAQFGWYGSQLGDRSARISAAEQQARTLDAALELLRRVEAGGP